jgi:hypothetical protein
MKAGLAWGQAGFGAKNETMTAMPGSTLSRIRFISTFLQRIIKSTVPGFLIVQPVDY